MEATAAGVAMFPGGIRLVKGGNHHRQNKPKSASCASSIPGRCSPVGGSIRASGFRDWGPVDFYSKAKKGGTKEKEAKKKKKLKLLQGLSKDLSTLTQMDARLLGSHGDHISEAAQVLMKHLQQLQAEEKQQMMMMRKEKEAAMVVDCGSSSESSSSSDDDDDDDDDQAIDISSFRDGATSVAAPQPTIPHLLGPDKSTSVSTLEARGSLAIHSLQHRASVDLNDQANTSAGNSIKRIEVCMGNKCKKSGSPALLEEFERAVGSSGAGAVVRCKCMGKCRDGPNVRLFNSTLDDGADVSVKAPPNPLFLGVALEDVDIIVAKLFAQELGVSPSF